MNVVGWNCRGLGNSNIRRSIKDLCRFEMPDVLCLLETRLNNAYALTLPGALTFEYNHRVPSKGFSGGL